MNLKGTKEKNQVAAANIFEQQELLKKAEVIKNNLTDIIKFVHIYLIKSVHFSIDIYSGHKIYFRT